MHKMNRLEKEACDDIWEAIRLISQAYGRLDDIVEKAEEDGIDSCELFVSVEDLRDEIGCLFEDSIAELEEDLRDALYDESF